VSRTLKRVDRRTGPFTDVELRSGDLLVLGRSNRRIFHGVPKVASAPHRTRSGCRPDGSSITIRETGSPESRIMRAS
jgi:alkylated DNA repair protein (DNA oxidative demethylase)